MGTLAMIGYGADSGIITNFKGTWCFYTSRCSYFGWNTMAGGALGGVAQVSSGKLCSGSYTSYGVYWYGGKGRAGQGQFTISEDGEVAYGRVLGGKGAGGGAGFVVCDIDYYCTGELPECKCQK